MRPIALFALLLLAACAQKAEVALEPEVVVEGAVSAPLADQRCQPGDDDGIGGTGCQVD
ncbi:hypothetical protein [Tabrizicola sp.]|jgi:hypothetical protein|uniref:hypothetical protein n=1 Tax=Tabrizicola sp. TaxID=2005166 RepID=UPI001A3FDD26|nr:hypothetical protein [Tabrizicola sp.]MBL9064264.1 hypothetical protein [Tabrizicola sp.]